MFCKKKKKYFKENLDYIYTCTFLYMVSNATVEFWMEGGPVLLEEGCWIKFGKVTTKGLSQPSLDSHQTTWSEDYQQ